MNTTKIYGADGNKFNHTDQDAIERFWRHLLGGAASLRFHRPDSGLGINNKAVACLRAARIVEQHVPFWTVEPANELLAEREENEAYAAASEQQDRIVLYFPASSKKRRVVLRTKNQGSEAIIAWIDIDKGTVQETSPLDGQVITPPTAGNLAAVISFGE